MRKLQKYQRRPFPAVVKKKKPVKVSTDLPGFTIRKKDMPEPSTVSCCKKCSRMYLDKLDCLFCEVYAKNAEVLQYK